MKRVVVGLLTILMAWPVFGVPNVTGITGTISNGQSITITGTGFGANGPTVALFTRNELDTGETIMDLTKCEKGQWTRLLTNTPKTVDITTYSFSGTRALWTDTNAQGSNQGPEFDLAGGANVPQVFMDWTTALNKLGTGSVNYKMMWIMRGGTTDGDMTPNMNNSNWSNGTMQSNDMTTAGIPPSWRFFGLSTAFTAQTYKHFQWDMVAGDTMTLAGSCKFWEINPTNGVVAIINQSNTATTVYGKTTGWQTVRMMGYDNQGAASVQPYQDDTYIATGTYRLARVHLTNNATFASATNMAIFLPTAWSDTSITATVYLGSFTSGTAYIIVADSSDAKSSGYSVTIGNTYGGGGGGGSGSSTRTNLGGSRERQKSRKMD